MYNALFCELPCTNYDFNQKMTDMQKLKKFTQNLLNYLAPLLPLGYPYFTKIFSFISPMRT